MANNLLRVRDIHSKKISGMGRRRFLETLASAGFTGAAAYLSIEDVKAASTDEVPIVVGFRSDEPKESIDSMTPVVEYVPADWYNNLQQAREVQSQFEQSIGEMEDVVGIGVEAGKTGGENASVRVNVLPGQKSQMLGAIPESEQGVPVEISEAIPPQPGACNTGDFGDTIPGGVRGISTSNSGAYGTLGSATIANGNRRFITAHHLYGRRSIRGESLFHPKRGNRIGEVVRTHCYDDFVLAAPRNGHRPTRRIEDARYPRVRGMFSRDGVTNLRRRGIRLKKVGCTSCLTSGEVKSANYTFTYGYGCIPRDGQIRWGRGRPTFTDGDSGTMIYSRAPNGNNVSWVAGNAQWYQNNAVGGTSTWSINNKHGYTW